MEIFKGAAGIRLTFDELVKLVEHDMLDDMIKLVSTLDALDIDIEELLGYLDEDEIKDELRIDQILGLLYPDHEEDSSI
jgi:hypothetical protein